MGQSMTPQPSDGIMLYVSLLMDLFVLCVCELFDITIRNMFGQLSFTFGWWLGVVVIEVLSKFLIGIKW